MDDEGRGTPEDPGEEWWDEADGDDFRGWIPPDDRLWRHPSESGAQAFVAGGAPGRPVVRTRTSPWVVGGATACVVLALVATGLIVMTAGSSDQGVPGEQARVASLPGVPTTEVGMGRMPDAAAIADMVSAARPSVVALTVGMPTGTVTGTGIVVESGGIIVTASQLVSGARTVTAVETGGSRQAAEVVGIDVQSGLAVLRIGDDLPAARFDLSDPGVDSVAVAMALRSGARGEAPPSAKVYAGTVASVGRSAGAEGATHLLSASVVEAPLSHDDIGCPLLDSTGQVSGLLEWTAQTGGGTTAAFLPAEVVLGVAQQLVSSGAMDHGWLGIVTSDAGTGDPVTTAHTTATTSDAPLSADGARLDVVDQNSPAQAAGLQVGDVIVGVDGGPVRSKSELDARLYPDGPGTALDLSLVRNGATMTLPVVLADGDSDASGGESSP